MRDLRCSLWSADSTGLPLARAGPAAPVTASHLRGGFAAPGSDRPGGAPGPAAARQGRVAPGSADAARQGRVAPHLPVQRLAVRLPFGCRSVPSGPTSRANPAVSPRCRPGQQKTAIRALVSSSGSEFARWTRVSCRGRAWTGGRGNGPARRNSHRPVQVPFSAACAVIEQKPDAPEVVLRPPEPVPDCDRSRRQCGIEERLEAPDGIPGPRLVRQCENAGLDERAPSFLAGDRPKKPALPVHRREQVLDIGQTCLDLDRHHGSIGRAPAEHVDRPALTVDREGVLRDRFPSEPTQPAGHRPHEQGMPFVEEPRRLGPSPSGFDGQRNPERGSQASRGSERGLLEPSPLDARDDGTANPGRSRRLTLAPAAPKPDRSEDRT